MRSLSCTVLSPSCTTHMSLLLIEFHLEGIVVGQDYGIGFMRIPVESQGRKTRRDEEERDEEAPPSRRQHVSPDEETE